ncbi:DUF4158 domain-containing protein [Aneurinibacillus aneurinilyticus]|nr:DUF4158 domain-containing protein [Aneurinibacillus aneurinilyticus]
MKRNWIEEELVEHFTLLPSEYHVVMGNKTSVNRLGFAVLLKYFQQEARFPTNEQEIPKITVEYIAKQIDVSPNLFTEYSWGGKEKTYT